MVKIKWVISIVCFMFLAGCATMPPKLTKPLEKSRTFKASYEETWKAAIQSLTASGEFISVAQKDSGLISFQKSIPINEIEKVALTSDVMAWDSANANVSLIVIKQDEENVKVTVNTKIWGIGRNIGVTIWWGGVSPLPVKQIEMGSAGVIEREYLDKIEALIPGAKKYGWLEKKENSENKRNVK